ncbi:PREDICTED: matrix metalloproteinase-2-like isoform X1 [Branchiostoma belcheri]|uniref:Matrix metalloproteinase-2-like isoform X1 n=1 Tax=Branchiostoma belcheri TaxID=7741 RepID=A0A6P4XUR8_BRABE|nr:PREDICTED: matrix metalloproteinase-2-like isoform X1 [Branchiostoma belcheri]
MAISTELVTFLIWVSILSSSQGGGKKGLGGMNPHEYLHKFGYIKPLKQGVQHEPSAWEEAIRDFQLMSNLPVTGQLDSPTVKKMKQPRCGVEDNVGTGLLGKGERSSTSDMRSRFEDDRRRTKRYTLQGEKWTKTHLTYYIVNNASSLPYQDVRAILNRAVQVWADVSPLTFEEKHDGWADLYIYFARGEHTDGPENAFDGPGGILGHAFFPTNGHAHFDDEEKWTSEGKDGKNLFMVAAHEFGHTLGLAHSNVEESLMSPYYQDYKTDFKMPFDDVMAIQQLYGKVDADRYSANYLPPAGPTPPLNDGTNSIKPHLRPTRKRKRAPNGCKAKFDAIFLGKQGQTFAFRDKHFWLIDDDGISFGYPKMIRKQWPGLKGHIDAAFTSIYTNKTYFFRGRKMWRFDGFTLDHGYPKSTARTGLPFKPDAAFVWGGNGQVYVFKGSEFWQFNEVTGRADPGFPRKIRATWLGIANNINAALQWRNGRTYFFKGDRYWRFDDVMRRKARGYPRSKAQAWMGCARADP